MCYNGIMLKKWSFAILASIIFSILGASAAYANNINSIDKVVVLNADGSAHITEIWQANLTQGTEGYETFSDLRGKTIENFRVSDDTGVTYEPQDYWPTKASFDSKAHKNGINKISDGLELCWGISEYGNRVYVLDYDIKNLVTLYADKIEGIHFNFLKMEQAVSRASIVVKMADGTALSRENARIWGFGYTGSVDFVEDGTLKFVSDGSIQVGDYIIALIRFQSQLFSDDTLITSEKTFTEVYEEALEGSDYKKQRQKYYNSYDSQESTAERIASIVVLVIFFAPFLLILFVIIKPNKRFKGVHVKNIRAFRAYDAPPTREVPCNKEIFPAFWLMENYSMDSERERKTGLVGAMILQLFLKKQIGFEKRTGTFWKKGKEVNYLDLRKAIVDKTTLEGEFVNILKDAAGINGLLEPNEFKRWSKRHYKRLSDWFDSAYDAGEERANALGYIEERGVERKNGWFRTKRTDQEKFTTEKAYNDAAKLAGFKKYLSGFSTVTEDIGVLETVIWEEYLIFAELFGIAKKISEQLKKLYPKIIEEWTKYGFDMDQMLLYISDFSTNAYSGMTTGIAAAKARHDVFSGGSGWSGGGGSSSSGGGGSSGGSSGGGFR